MIQARSMNNTVPASRILSRMFGVRKGDSANTIEAMMPSGTGRGLELAEILSAQHVGNENSELPAKGNRQYNSGNYLQPRRDFQFRRSRFL
jgi:hypothetical protein